MDTISSLPDHFTHLVQNETHENGFKGSPLQGVITLQLRCVATSAIRAEVRHGTTRIALEVGEAPAPR
jgi:hypothetical protein